MRPCAGLADRAFQHIAHTKLSPDFFDIDRPAFVGKARISGDNEEPFDAGQRGDDLLDHPIGKILLIRIGAQIDEGQNGD